MTPDRDRWLVYAGEAFNLWQPDTGKHFGSADVGVVIDHLFEKRKSQNTTKSSAFYGLDKQLIGDAETLPCRHPRIAFRDITHHTNTRTVVTALVPGRVVLTNKAPYLLFVEGTARDEAYLLGVLSSMILDWYARRVVEMSLNFFLLDNFPIPPHYDDDPVAARVVEIAVTLAAIDSRYDNWEEATGTNVDAATSETSEQDLVCELDACVAHLYGLDEDDLAVIYQTFRAGDDYSDRHANVLAYFRDLPPFEPAALRAARLAEEGSQ